MDKVSVIILTYNRFKYLMYTIKSVKEQTHKNLEIIVVNDCSTEKEYYDLDWLKEAGYEKHGDSFFYPRTNNSVKFRNTIKWTIEYFGDKLD